jgi:hypothetical protein
LLPTFSLGKSDFFPFIVCETKSSSSFNIQITSVKLNTDQTLKTTLTLVI